MVPETTKVMAPQFSSFSGQSMVQKQLSFENCKKDFRSKSFSNGFQKGYDSCYGVYPGNQMTFLR